MEISRHGPRSNLASHSFARPVSHALFRRMRRGIAASNTPLEQGGYTVISRVSASDCKVNLFGIIPVGGGNSLEDAVQKAKRKSNAHALVDITVDRVSKFFFLWTSTCTEVRASAVTIP
jgi:hypothetical protein